MVKSKLKNKNILFNPFYMITFLFFIVLIVQLLVTYCYTNTKRFSIMALIRNSTFVIFIYLFIKTKNFLYLALPFLIEIFMETLKYYGYQLDKYIATEYLYSDFFKEIKDRTPMYTNLSEGLYDKIFGIDTLDHSPENLKKVLNWTKDVYDNAYKNKTQSVKGLNGKEYNDIYEIKKYGETNKFKTICELCNVHKDMTILEIGFGEGDFMNYIKDTYGIKTVGVSISEQQVRQAKSKGFEAYHLDMWNITDQIGKFDLVLQCGNLEYLRCCSESQGKYEEYFNIIKKIMNKNGKYFITCIHFYPEYLKYFTFYDYVRAYFLSYGNDGAYPFGKNILPESALKAKLKTTYKKEHTIDYLIEAVFFMSSYGFKSKHNNHVTFFGILESMIKTIADPYYIHSYLCYSSTKDYYWPPWLWQFVPRQRGDWFGTYISLEYFLLEHND